MALIKSIMQDIGTKAPNFSLLDTVSNNTLSLDDLKSNKATLIMFICNHCPYVKFINSGLSKLGKDYENSELSIIAISSNNIETHPMDGPEYMKQNAIDNEFNFPYLYDETQEVAKAYNAQCTPDFFLYNGTLELVYRGQFDSSRPDNGIPVTGIDIRNAIDATLEGKEVSKVQYPSIGCNIKWK